MKPEAGLRVAVDRWTIGLLAVAVMLALAVRAARAAAPANDTFADAQVLSGDGGTVTGTNAGATREPGEPDLTGLGMGFTVWYSWTAPASGQLEFNTNGSDFNTVLGIWTGSRVDALTYVAVNDSASSYDRIALSAAAGTTYRVQVDGRGFPTPTGTIVLNWLPLPAPERRDSGLCNATSSRATRDAFAPDALAQDLTPEVPRSRFRGRRTAPRTKAQPEMTSALSKMPQRRLRRVYGPVISCPLMVLLRERKASFAGLFVT